MSAVRVLALALIVAGAASLAYRGFTYVRHHDVDVGFFDLKYDDKETVFIPAWAGMAAIGVGAALLLVRKTA